MHRSVAILGLAVVLVGCLAEGPERRFPSVAPSTVQQPSPSAPSSVAPNSPAARPTPTPVPPIEQRGPGVEPPPASQPPVVVEPGVRRASREVDGVRVTIESAANPMIAGQPAWITTTLENTGRDRIHWTTDGCEIHVGVIGEMPFRWAGGFPQVGVAKTYKDWAYVANLPPLDSPIWLDPTPERFIGRDNFGCVDLGVPQQLDPGRQVRQRQQWDGTAARELGLPPAGPAEWIGSFSFWWRNGDPGRQNAENPREPIVVRLPVEIRSDRHPRALSAGQAIDAAVTIRPLRELLEANPSIQDWDMPITTRFDLEIGNWLIGLKVDDGRAVSVEIDGLTGAHVGTGILP